MFFVFKIYNFGNREKCYWRGYIVEAVRLPFAGITLFRFYGFDLSLQ
jgi:hypothetical protein